MSDQVLMKALAVTCETCGSQEFSDGAVDVIISTLRSYPEKAVLKAMRRCQFEVRGRLALADIVQRIDDGRPGAEEAWGMIPRSEAETVVWSDEMAEAWGVASSILNSGDEVGARMAFREAYTRLVREARESGAEPRFWVSLGHDVNGREPVIRVAYASERISLRTAQRHLPNLRIESEEMQEIFGGVSKRLTDGHAG